MTTRPNRLLGAMRPNRLLGATRPIHWLALLLLAVVVTPAPADAARRRPPVSTTFDFRVPTGTTAPVFDSTTAVVPNRDVFVAFDEYEAVLVPLVENAILAADGVEQLNHFSYDFPVPTVTLSGEQTSIIAELGGLENVVIDVDYDPDDFFAQIFCGSSIEATASLATLAIRVSFDFYSGSPLEVEFDYTGLSTDYECSIPIIGDITEFLNNIFGFVNVSSLLVEAIDSGEGATGELLNATFTNPFSLREVIAGVSEAGPREIRDAAEDVLALIGGASTAAAAFITQEITDELIVRLALQSQAEIDQLRELLRGLDDFIASGVPGLADFSLAQLTSASFDLSDYLDANAPDIQGYLLAQLDGVYVDAVTAVQNLEALAISALEDFVATDWSRLFGGVNVRVRLYPDSDLVIVDAFHDAPETFIGRAEAMGPCAPEYTIPYTENVETYSVYNSLGNRVYHGTDRVHLTLGLLSHASTENYFGLHSYPTNATITLYAWGDYPGDPADFVWPQCPIATSTQSSPGVDPPDPDPDPDPGGGGPGEPDCGPGTGVVCP